MEDQLRPQPDKVQSEQLSALHAQVRQSRALREQCGFVLQQIDDDSTVLKAAHSHFVLSAMAISHRIDAILGRKVELETDPFS